MAAYPPDRVNGRTVRHMALKEANTTFARGALHDTVSQNGQKAASPAIEQGVGRMPLIDVSFAEGPLSPEAQRQLLDTMWSSARRWELIEANE
jgi:hypothetical protein